MRDRNSRADFGIVHDKSSPRKKSTLLPVERISRFMESLVTGCALRIVLVGEADFFRVRSENCKVFRH